MKGRTVLRVLTAAARRLPCGAVAGGACRIARLIRMPLSLAVIAELEITAGTLAAEARARCAPGGDDGVAAVGRWAPA